MYEYPYGGEQQLNLNWIISEIIKIHKTLDPDYVAPTFDNTFPFTNLNALNLDWILKELRTIKDLAPTEDATILTMVANALIALSYTPDNTYDSGDIAYRDTTNRLYICMFDGTTGVWDDTKWDEFRIGEALTWLLTNPNATNSDNVSNDSTVTGDSVTDALDTLAGLINGLTASNISNDSNVTGATVKDALNNLNGAINDKILYFTSQAVSATTGNILDISNAKITADYVLLEATFANPHNITTKMTWTTSAGHFILNGTCFAATTANITLGKKGN